MEERNKVIKISIKYAFIAKFIGFLIQLGLIPLAIGKIGLEQYGLYSLLIATFSLPKI